MTFKRQIYTWLIIGYILFAASIYILYRAFIHLNQNMDVLYYNQQQIINHIENDNNIRIEIPSGWQVQPQGSGI